MTQATAQEILDFWFSQPVKACWFERSDVLDQQIIQRFSDIYQAACSGQLQDWQQKPETALALTIILDQFARNMFRGSPKAFAGDAQARSIANDALAKNYDQAVSEVERPFFYLPLMHSEILADQQHSLDCYHQLGNPISLDFAQQHYDIIKQFGRFPHRNAVLGRQSTAEEIEFLKTHSGF